jgi:hypothetical protein
MEREKIVANKKNLKLVEMGRPVITMAESAGPNGLPEPRRA